MQPFPVVEDFYVVEQISPYIFNCSIFTPVKVFLFQACEEAFHTAVVIRASGFAQSYFLGSVRKNVRKKVFQ